MASGSRVTQEQRRSIWKLHRETDADGRPKFTARQIAGMVGLKWPGAVLRVLAAGDPDIADREQDASDRPDAAGET